MARNAFFKSIEPEENTILVREDDLEDDIDEKIEVIKFNIENEYTEEQLEKASFAQAEALVSGISKSTFNQDEQKQVEEEDVKITPQKAMSYLEKLKQRKGYKEPEKEDDNVVKKEEETPKPLIVEEASNIVVPTSDSGIITENNNEIILQSNIPIVINYNVSESFKYIVGKVHFAYIPCSTGDALSLHFIKNAINEIVEKASSPQLIAKMLHDYISESIKHNGISVILVSEFFTSICSSKNFKEQHTQNELYNLIKLSI